MRFGVREICDVVFRAKTAMKIGEKVFYKNEPVLYFDSLKTSSLEGAATTVYATGGRGNARLVAWEGERTVTFTMEDALISEAGLSILTGAKLIDAETKEVIQHVTERTDAVAIHTTTGSGTTYIDSVTIKLAQKPYIKGLGTTAANHVYSGTVQSPEDYIYVMLLNDRGDIISEPYIASEVAVTEGSASSGHPIYSITISRDDLVSDDHRRMNDLSDFKDDCPVLVDYYVLHNSRHVYQADISPEMFAGNFYVEASTLFRDAATGVDMPAEFIIPNCKVQSNFTFTMAPTGDPTTFTFTMDAFPDYTRWNPTKKVFASLQIIGDAAEAVELERLGTSHNNSIPITESDPSQSVGEKYTSTQAKVIEPLEI